MTASWTAGRARKFQGRRGVEPAVHSTPGAGGRGRSGGVGRPGSDAVAGGPDRPGLYGGAGARWAVGRVCGGVRGSDGAAGGPDRSGPYIG